MPRGQNTITATTESRILMDKQSDYNFHTLNRFQYANRQWMFYAGPSMNPTLRASDVLHIVPYEGRKIRLGDVIVFTSPDGERAVVHRVVSRDAQGVRTRGDNTPHVDASILQPSHIIGRVVLAQRGTKTRRVYGGIGGRTIGHVMNLRGIIDRKLSAVPKIAPQSPKLLRAVGAWFFSRMRTRIVQFSSREGSELQMLLGDHLIARLPAGKERWVIRRRFRFFIDEAALPDRDACVEQHEPK